MIPTQCSTSATRDCQWKKKKKATFQLGLYLCLYLLKLMTQSPLCGNMNTFCKDLSSQLEQDIQKKSCMVPFPVDFLAWTKICICVRKRCMTAHDLHSTTTLPVHSRSRSSSVGFPLWAMKCPDNAAPVEPDIWLSSLRLGRISGFSDIYSTVSSIILHLRWSQLFLWHRALDSGLFQLKSWSIAARIEDRSFPHSVNHCLTGENQTKVSDLYFEPSSCWVF